MADGTPQPEFNISYCYVKGFTELGVEFLTFTCQVPDFARCKHCNCIPERIYHLLCPHHGLCLDCTKCCYEFYCDECRIETTPEQLGALRSEYNFDGSRLKVLCDVCDKELLLGQLQTHMSRCQKMERECSDCGVNVPYENLQDHRQTECQKRVVLCYPCAGLICYDECGVHEQECPEALVVCDDCEGGVLRREKSKHASECPKRVVCCENCEGFYSYSSEKEHREQCEKKKLACEHCKLELKGDHEKNAHLEICEDASIECAFKEFGCSEKLSDATSHGYGYHVAMGDGALLRECRGYLNEEPGPVCEPNESVGLWLLSSRIANKMADRTPLAEFNITYHEVKGFTGPGVDFLRFPYQVPDRARCKHCNCIPKRMYHLLCPHHGLCLDCRRDCDGYYCDECRVHTTPEQLGALRSGYNLDGMLLVVQCDVCDKEVLLGELEEHLCKHTNQGRLEASKVQQTTNQHHDVSEKPLRVSDAVSERCHFCNENVKNSDYVEHINMHTQERNSQGDSIVQETPNQEHLKMHTQERNNQGDSIVQETPNQDTAIEVEETRSDETRPSTDYSDYKEHSLDGTHMSQCPKLEKECSDCGVNVLNEDLQHHLDTECHKRWVLCGACDSTVVYDERGKHRSECPKIERKCFDCGVNVLNENLRNHQDMECQKRVVLCDACNGVMSYDKLGDHHQECLVKPVVCNDCEGEVLRKEKSKHASECPMRLVYCENCDGFYVYSFEKEHREQCERKKPACEYFKLEPKGDDEKKAHLKICEEASIECAFKDFGCKEKFPRKEMQEHEKDPHNALLIQVILGEHNGPLMALFFRDMPNIGPMASAAWGVFVLLCFQLQKAMDTISELKQKIKDIERCNMSQQEEAQNKEAKLVKKIQELENRQLTPCRLNGFSMDPAVQTLCDFSADPIRTLCRPCIASLRTPCLNKRKRGMKTRSW